LLEGSQATPTRPSAARLYNTKEISPYLKENTTLHHYKDQLLNAVQGHNRRLNQESYKTHEYKMQSDSWLKKLVDIFTIRPLRVKNAIDVYCTIRYTNACF
jgi:hypothetical protein